MSDIKNTTYYIQYKDKEKKTLVVFTRIPDLSNGGATHKESPVMTVETAISQLSDLTKVKESRKTSVIALLDDEIASIQSVIDELNRDSGVIDEVK
jgi:hypothetical protein